MEYRIESGCVETRTLGAAGERDRGGEKQWQRLTSEQIGSHVLAGTVVARWLRRRMGVHRLIRACASDEGRDFSKQIVA